MRASVVVVFSSLTWFALPVRAQTVDDGVLLQRRALGAGVLYSHEGWSEYWEGTLQRINGTIGTVSTQSVTLVAGYGVTDRFSVMAMLPYVWTHASQGPLHGMSGVQDVTVAAKYQVLATPFTERGTLRAFVVGAAGIPASSYVPDFLPLSIGLASRRFSGRFTLNFQAHQGGGDIRRQDMPFVSNRMDLAKVDGLVMYNLPAPGSWASASARAAS